MEVRKHKVNLTYLNTKRLNLPGTKGSRFFLGSNYGRKRSGDPFWASTIFRRFWKLISQKDSRSIVSPVYRPNISIFQRLVIPDSGFKDICVSSHVNLAPVRVPQGSFTLFVEGSILLDTRLRYCIYCSRHLKELPHSYTRVLAGHGYMNASLATFGLAASARYSCGEVEDWRHILCNCRYMGMGETWGVGAVSDSKWLGLTMEHTSS